MDNIKKIILAVMVAGKPCPPAAFGLISILAYAGQCGLFGFLYGLSWLYRFIVIGRVRLYQARMFKQITLPCPVISIGNITTGGTGKTPMVALLAEILSQQGQGVVILSRGYRRQSQKAAMPRLVDAQADVRVVGDEPLLLARHFRQNAPQVRVMVDRQRARAGQLACTQFQPDVILLDDGFQHLPVARTCDLVLIDATNPFGGERLLPAGFLREPLSHLARAHAFVITRSNEITDLTAIRTRLQVLNPTAPIFTARLVFDRFRHAVSGECITFEDVQRQQILALSGIGNPESFQRLLTTLPLQIGTILAFPDHHWYTATDITTIRQNIATQQLDAIVTTEKDETKLAAWATTLAVPIYIATITMQVEPAPAFDAFIRRVCHPM
jgi:tetraacyldisaccharide 4'-kinase